MDKLSILRNYFGYAQFRPGQEGLIDAVLSGRDVFGIMPTGGGKSICYQVPALLLPGVTLVVSPLISLMQDQVRSLKAVGIPAAYINSTLTGPQMQAVYRNLYAGAYKIIYIAPERLGYEGFQNVAAKMSISFVAVDEAHCISQWGQDFRPSYLRILNFIESLPYRPILGAFTATATQEVREDVERILELKDPLRVVTGFDRPNLSFDVMTPQGKDAELLRLMASRRRKSGIIYCATRKKVESVCELLKNKGYQATRYHAGLEEDERRQNQEDFIHDRSTVMVATNAFGMGIDKSNVSFVIHYNMPKSIEAYYQEAGRAGRDGSDAECILLYSKGDVNTAIYFINSDNENEELDEAQREQVRAQDMKRLDAMIGYCQTKTCLRAYILEYFGQKHGQLCGNCGNCRGQFENADITREAQMILSCIIRIRDALGYGVGAATVARVLQGAKEKKILEQRLDKLSTFGLLKDRGRTQIREMIDQLEADGYVETELTHQTVLVTSKASQVLYRGQKVEMLVRKEEEEPAAPKVRSVEAPAKLTAKEADLYEALRELRADLAREAGTPAYVIFSNATLADMAKKAPRNLTQFKKVSGVGELKASWYGKQFLARIKEQLENEEM